MNQTALITGAAKRLGKAMAIHLAEKGWNLALHYNSSANEAETVCFELREKFPKQRFELFQANLSKADEVEKLIPEILHKMPALHLLINNASVFEPSRIAETTAEFLDDQFNVNFRAPFLLTKAFTNTCRSGLIVNFADTRIVSNDGKFAAYSLAKKTLWELTKMAALEFGPGIRVNAIAPGLTLPPEGKDQNYLEELSQKIAMKKPGGIKPILKSLDYIIDNDYLTGQLLFCDGGENLGPTNK